MADEKFIMALRDVVYAECDEIANSDSEHVFSDRFERRMSRLIAQTKKPYFRMTNTVTKRLICAAVIIAIGAFAAVMSVEAVRSAIANFFMDNQKEYSSMVPLEDEGIPLTVEDAYEITALPEGYTITYEFDDEQHRKIIYTNEYEYICFIQCTNEYMSDINYNTENAPIEILTLDGYEVIYYYAFYGEHNLIWSMDGYSFNLSATIDKNELIKLFESVQKVE